MGTVGSTDISDARDQHHMQQLITVCDECLRASCWQGIFMCERAQNAGTVEKSKEELRELGIEHEDYWDE